jgi:hypothetical protein
MKYAIEYTKKCKYLDDIDEYLVKYVEGKDEELVKFINSIDKRVIITIEEEQLENFVLNKKLKYWAEAGCFGYTFRLPGLNTSVSAQKIKLVAKTMWELNIPHFFNQYVNSIDLFHSMINTWQVSDIYITDELGFELANIAPIAKENNVKIRVFPNIAQAIVDVEPKIKQFFIRPEDVAIYEPYVDVLELFGEKEDYNFLYKVYALDKKWFGDLSELINGVEIDSRRIVPEFGEKRSRCGKKCFKGGKCKMCDRVQELAETLEEHELFIKQNKE